MDLASLDSVASAAKEFVASNTRLDILLCNAGVMATRPALSVDDYEIQFATNFLGHACLMEKLVPVLRSTASGYGDARIVCFDINWLSRCSER